ncbi:MAG: amidohydrolase family protein, partial [Myxococcales bacterium]|nr:amidohydrolase family protein [Myxococcales bacterium]
MERILFQNGRLLDPEASDEREGFGLLVEQGRIRARIGPGEAAPESARVVDLAGRALAPGFIDVHFHGSLIFDALDAPAASLRHDAASILRHGSTAFLTTTIALGRQELGRRVEAIARAADELAEATETASVLGIHLEGPWISGQAPGAQPPDAIRAYDAAEGRAVLDAGSGCVKMVTLAPEVPGCDALVAELERRGVVRAMGHTRAGAEQASDAFDRGVRHVTHLFNAMGSFHHREPGAIGATLADERVSCDLICDGVHVHPAAVRTAARAKRDQLILITDRIDPPEGGGVLGEG